MAKSDDFFEAKLQQITKTSKSSAALRRGLIEYWQEVARLAQAGEIDREAACYNIACVMSVPEIANEPSLESIALEAGELELPKEHVSGDAQKRWEALQEEIFRLSA